VLGNQQHLGMFSTEITNERPFVVVKESNVSLLCIRTLFIQVIASDDDGGQCHIRWKYWRQWHIWNTEIYAVFGFCAVRNDSSVQASRDNLIVPTSGLR